MRVLRRLWYWLRAGRVDRDLSEEIETHRALAQARLEAEGLSAAAAAAASRRAMGNVALAREDARGEWIAPALDQLWRDIRCSARTIARQRGFAATAMLTLAVGVGATAASVSVIEAELWRPLPFHDPDRLITINTAPAGTSAWDQASGPELELWQADARALDGVAGMGASPRRVLRGRGTPEFVRTREVTASFFATLGWTTALGRRFEPEDADGGRAVILSDGCWRRFFGADPAVVGQSIVLDDQSYDVVGVLAPVERLEFTYDPDLYTVLDPAAVPMRDPDRRVYTAIARLRAGHTAATARDDLARLAQRIALEQSPATQPREVSIRSLGETFTGFNWRALYFFLGASVFVLALSCANVANLLLARALHRRREFAVRAALGGGRGALIRQLLVEGLLIAIPATLAGSLAAFWALRALAPLIPPDYLSRGGHFVLDLRAAAVAAVLCVLTTLVAGLVPALFTRVDLSGELSQASRAIAGARGPSRVRQTLVVGEVTIAFVLVLAAGLLLNSYVRLRNAPLGFDPGNRLVVGVPLSGDRYASPVAVRAFADRLIAETQGVAGVARAAVGTSLPLGSGPPITFDVGDRPASDPAVVNRGLIRAVSPSYFEALGMRMVAGRPFSTADAPGAPMVAVINETLAARFFADGGAIGSELAVAPRRSLPWFTAGRVRIVGVVANSKDIDVHEVAFNSVYVPFAQHPAAAMQLVVQTSVPAASAIRGVRDGVLAVDRDLPVLGITTLEARVDQSLGPNRFNLVLLASFAVVAIALAAIGLYGAMAYNVEQRIPELGLRLALGARATELMVLALGQALRLGAAGAVLGLAVSLLLARAIGDALYLVQGRSSGVIYGITIDDPLTLACAGGAVLAIAAIAGAVPARRAMRIDPAVALKGE